MLCVVPDVQENQLSSAVHVKFIRQSFEEVAERGSKLLAALACSRCKEEHEDAVLQAQDDLSFCVQLVLVLVVLYQDVLDEQVHHDGAGLGITQRKQTTSTHRFNREIIGPKSNEGSDICDKVRRLTTKYHIRHDKFYLV